MSRGPIESQGAPVVSRLGDTADAAQNPDTTVVSPADHSVPPAALLDHRANRAAEPSQVRFGNYELIEEIARGGMGVIFKAQQLVPRRIVALKMIRAGKLADDEEVRRFRAEADAAAHLEHPNIVPIYEFGEQDGQQFLSMPYVNGSSLAARVAQGPLPPREAATLVKTVTGAVAFAHERGVIHRDLKPANILVDQNGQPRITDFGLAKKTEADSSLTGTGQILGTPSFMPPEQASGQISQIGPASDVYSLGAVLYCLLTGRPPFQAATAMDTLFQVLREEPVSPRQLNSAVDRDLETICLKCLEKDGAKRYQSAKELEDDLARLLLGQPILARPIGRLARAARWCQRNKLVTAFIVVLGVSTIGGTALTIEMTRQRNEARRQMDAAVTEKKRADDAVKLEEYAKKRALDEEKKANEFAQIAIDQKRVAGDLAIQERQQKELALAEKERVEQALTRSVRLRYATQIAAAQTAWAANDAAAASQYLESCPENLRGWEHRYLDTLFRHGPSTFAGKLAGVSSLAISPDGKWIIAGNKSGELKVCDATTSAETMSLPRHVEGVSSVAFSPDGNQIAIGSADGSIKLIDATSGKETQSLGVRDQGVSSVSFSPDGKRLVAGCAGGTIAAWDTTSGAELSTWNAGQGIVRSVAFSPNGRHVVSASEDGTVTVWDAETKMPELKLNGKTGEEGNVASSPDGKTIAFATESNKVVLRDMQNGQEVVTLSADGSQIVFSPDGTRIVIGGRDHTVTIWEATTGDLMLTLRGHSQPVTNVAISADGSRIVSASEDGTIRMWDAGRTAP